MVENVDISTCHLGFNVSGADFGVLRSEVVKRIAELFPEGVGDVEVDISLTVMPDQTLQADDGTLRVTMWEGNVSGRARIKPHA